MEDLALPAGSFRGNFLAIFDSMTISLWDLTSLIFLLFFLFVIIYPQSQLKRIRIQRMTKLRALEKRHDCKVLTIIHRREAISFLGVPAYQFIDEEDAEQVLRWIRKYKDYPLELILHTPGGQLLASVQIARALRKHPKKTRVSYPPLFNVRRHGYSSCRRRNRNG